MDHAIERVLDAASVAREPEREVLVSEVVLLRSLKEQVEHRDLTDREPIRSRLIALSVREQLQIPSDLLEQVGSVFEVYRRHLTSGCS